MSIAMVSKIQMSVRASQDKTPLIALILALVTYGPLLTALQSTPKATASVSPQTQTMMMVQAGENPIGEAKRDLGQLFKAIGPLAIGFCRGFALAIRTVSMIFSIFVGGSIFVSLGTLNLGALTDLGLFGATFVIGIVGLSLGWWFFHRKFLAPRKETNAYSG